jgi:histidinol-phosphate/aromatic aminotransferase/cobyric acid decarboxylase-like protein|tara:strand:+ start:1589 stop:1867 length:279 start_codon:yes stop_codon:yes gene_type:complete
MQTSKLVNDYVKAYQNKGLIAASIVEKTQALQRELKAQEKQLAELKESIIKELENSNSKRLESTTNFVIWNPSPVVAHVRNTMYVNRYPKSK